MKPFGQLKNEVARKLSVPVGGDYANTQVRDWLQARYKRIWDYALWPQALDVVSVTVSANSNTFQLPKRYEFAVAHLNVTGNSSVDQFNLVEFARRHLDGSVTSSGPTTEMAPLGSTGVSAQISAAGTVKVKSSSSSDTSKSVYVVGLVAGEIQGEVITTNSTNGTTLVAGTLTFTEIHRVTKLANPTAGIITLYESDGTTALATIAPWETTPEYKKYRVVLTSATAQSITVIGKRRFVPFLNNADVAVFDMDAALVAGATADGWREHRQYDMAAAEESEFQTLLPLLLARELNMAGQVETMVPAGRF